MGEGKCELNRRERIIYPAVLAVMVVAAAVMIHADAERMGQWQSKLRVLKKIEQEQPQEVGTVEVWDGQKKRVYYGLVTIENDGSNGEMVSITLDGVLQP